MVGLLKKWLDNPKQRMIVAFIGVAFFIACAFLFIGNELLQNQAYFIRVYETEQQLLVKQVAVRTNELLSEKQADEQEVIKRVVKDLETSGRRFWFFEKNGKIWFIKNEETTKLYGKISLASFMEQYPNRKMLISSESMVIGKDTYKVGICTEEDYFLEAGHVTKHNIYILMSVMVVCFCFFAMSIVYLSIINNHESKIKSLDNKILSKNLIVESLIMKRKRMDSFHQNRRVYNKEVFISLLKKIKKEKLGPISLIVVDMVSEKSDFYYNDYHKLIQPVSDLIEEEHVIAEISQGTFSILLFHSNMMNTEHAKNTLISKWGKPLNESGMKIRIGVSLVEDVELDIEDIFASIYRSVVGEVYE